MWRFALVLVGLMVLSSASYGQTVRVPLACAPEEFQDRHLREKFKEEPVGYGATSGGAMAELWVSEENDTWTITLRLPNGLLCLLASGDGWRKAPERMKGIGL